MKQGGGGGGSGSGGKKDSRMDWRICSKLNYGVHVRAALMLAILLSAVMCAAEPGHEHDAALTAITDPSNVAAAEIITTTEFGECHLMGAKAFVL